MPGAENTRIAVLADIHGNADALHAVLSDIDRQSPDLIVNLGDHFSGPLAAGETAARLRDRPDIVSIRGNHDRYLIEQEPAEMGPSDAAAFADLQPQDLAWLRRLPPVLQIADIFLCHGTPKSDTTYWLEHLIGARLSARPLGDVARFAANIDAKMFLCAHTHIPRSVRLENGAWIINPGSVGCPGYDDDHPVYHIVETGTPAASYALIERKSDLVSITHRLIPYDTKRMAELAMAAGREGWARAVSTGWYSR